MPSSSPQQDTVANGQPSTILAWRELAGRISPKSNVRNARLSSQGMSSTITSESVSRAEQSFSVSTSRLTVSESGPGRVRAINVTGTSTQLSVRPIRRGWRSSDRRRESGIGRIASAPRRNQRRGSKPIRERLFATYRFARPSSVPVVSIQRRTRYACSIAFWGSAPIAVKLRRLTSTTYCRSVAADVTPLAICCQPADRVTARSIAAPSCSGGVAVGG